jgi:hypothetical protein
MTIKKTPPAPMGGNPYLKTDVKPGSGKSSRRPNVATDQRDSTILNQIKQYIGVSINVYNDTVSIVRREADTFYDSVPADRLRPNTNGPRVICNDVQPAVDRVVSQVASAYYKEDCIIAEPIGDDDREAAEQNTKMVRNIIFNQNNGKIILRDSIKSAAKYPFGGALRVYRDEKERTYFHSMVIPDIYTMEDAEAAAKVIVETNTAARLREWRLLKVKEETYEEAVPGRDIVSHRREYTAEFEICQYEVTYPILVVPPEEFLMDKEATSIETSKFVCQRRFMPRTDILEMWPDAREFPEDLGSVATSYNTNFSNEKQYRRRVHNTLNITSRPATFDSTMKVCMVVEGYIRYDYDGDGIAEWRHFAIVDNTILENTYWDGPLPIVLPNLNRDPHRPDEITIAERAKDSTLAKTAMLRGDLKAQQDRTNLQIIAKSGAFPLTGQRKLMEGTPGIIPYGQNEQGQQLAISGPLSDSVYAIPKPEPSAMTAGLFQMLDAQRSSQTGVNSLNDQVGRNTQQGNPATNALLQQREQDIQVEDYIMCYGETAVKPLFRIVNWFLSQDADHPSVKERFVRVTGQPSLDHARLTVGEWRLREDYTVNVGLGVDSPEYRQARATQLLMVFQQFNQSMSGSVLPNLLPKMYEGFRDQVTSLGYDPDQNLMSRDEFDQYYQNLIQLQQQKSQQPDPMQQLQMELLKAEIAKEQANAQKLAADAQRAQAEAEKAQIETQVAMMQLQTGQIGSAKTIV